jgi:MFS family permease
MVALNVMGVNLIAPVLPAYASHFGVGFGAASTVVTVFAISRMSLRVTAGTLADRHGSRLVCTAGGLTQATGALLAAVSPGFAVLLVARAVQGAGSSLFGTSINRYLLVVTDKAELGRATAGFQAGILIGVTIGPLIGGVAAEQFGIFAPFYFQAAIALLLAGVSASYVRDGRDHHVRADRGATRPTSAYTFRALIRIRGFRLLMFLGFGLFFVRAGAINVLVPAFADDVLGLSPSEIGAVISVGSIVSLLVIPVAGHLADAVGRVPVAIAGACMTAVCVALYGLAQGVVGLLVVSGILGIGIGLAAVAMPTMIGDIAPAGTEGRASGVYRIASDMGWVVGPTTLGLLADSSHYGIAFFVAGLPILVGGLLLTRSKTLRNLDQTVRDTGVD